MDKNPRTPEARVPVRYPTSLVFIDESGSATSGGRFFVMGAVKVRRPGLLQREIQAVRDRHNFSSEFKFSDITRGGLAPYYDLIDTVMASDACFAATVVNRDIHDPFPGRQPWQAHLEVATQLLVGCIVRRELVSVVMDAITTPQGVSLEDQLRERVNQRLHHGSVVTAAAFDSRSTDLLQAADLLASAIGFNRRGRANAQGGAASTSSPKAQVAARLMSSLGCTSFDDTRISRLNVATMRAKSRVRVLQPRLEVVTGNSA